MGAPEERRNLSLCVKSVFQTFHQYYTFLENKTELHIPQLAHESSPRWNDQFHALFRPSRSSSLSLAKFERQKNNYG